MWWRQYVCSTTKICWMKIIDYVLFTEKMLLLQLLLLFTSAFWSLYVFHFIDNFIFKAGKLRSPMCTSGKCKNRLLVNTCNQILYLAYGTFYSPWHRYMTFSTTITLNDHRWVRKYLPEICLQIATIYTYQVSYILVTILKFILM